MDKDKIILPERYNVEATETRRASKRRKEDENYLPVIVKRLDAAIRHPDDILENAIHEGLEQHKRSKLSLFLSACSAGLILGFAGMCVALASQIYSGPENIIWDRVAVGLVYPLGFIICIMSGTQLFTEQTATAVYPVLDKKASLNSLMKLWIIVLVGNLVGTLLSTYLLASAEHVIQAAPGYREIAGHILEFEFREVLISAILAGWLMAQGGWLTLATPPASSQLICIYIVTFIIGIGSLHHSIAGSAEIFGGIFLSENPDYLGSARFISAAVLGNIIGGSVFVAILNYAHIKKTQ